MQSITYFGKSVHILQKGYLGQCIDKIDMDNKNRYITIEIYPQRPEKELTMKITEAI